MKGVVDYHQGTLINISAAPDEVIEHILASEYGWNLEYIERLPPKKMQIHVSACLIKKRIDSIRSRGQI